MGRVSEGIGFPVVRDRLSWKLFGADGVCVETSQFPVVRDRLSWKLTCPFVCIDNPLSFRSFAIGLVGNHTELRSLRTIDGFRSFAIGLVGNHKDR